LHYGHLPGGSLWRLRSAELRHELLVGFGGRADSVRLRSMERACEPEGRIQALEPVDRRNRRNCSYFVGPLAARL
jgi:hypothetical protein